MAVAEQKSPSNEHCENYVQTFFAALPTVIELSLLIPAESYQDDFPQTSKKILKTLFTVVTILIPTEAKCMAPEYFNKFQEKRLLS